MAFKDKLNRYLNSKNFYTVTVVVQIGNRSTEIPVRVEAYGKVDAIKQAIEAAESQVEIRAIKTQKLSKTIKLEQ